MREVILEIIARERLCQSHHPLCWDAPGDGGDDHLRGAHHHQGGQHWRGQHPRGHWPPGSCRAGPTFNPRILNPEPLKPCLPRSCGCPHRSSNLFGCVVL